MKLLMITRKVDLEDSSPAGFTYNWVKKIGEKLDKLYVITWQKSNRGNLPENIEIISLPNNKFLKVFVLQFKLLKILLKVNGVFCHQNPEYTILSAFLAKIFRKKIVSWYAHGTVNWKTKLVLVLANKVITSTPKGFRIDSPKVSVIGQGIDVELFKPVEKKLDHQDIFKMITVGRISPTKDYESMIKAVDCLVYNGIKNIKLTIIGGSGLREQNVYLESLKKMIILMKLKDKVKLIGEMPNEKIIPYLQESDLFINLSQTGSLDKAILEAMACGVIVLTANESCNDILPRELLVLDSHPKELSEKIKMIIDMPIEKRKEYIKILRQEVVKNHNLNQLAVKIIAQFE